MLYFRSKIDLTYFLGYNGKENGRHWITVLFRASSIIDRHLTQIARYDNFLNLISLKPYFVITLKLYRYAC